MLYIALFVFGTFLAGFGWVIVLKYPEVMSIRDAGPTPRGFIALFQYGIRYLLIHPLLFQIAGHVLQIVGAFGLLVTPDYAEEE